MNRSLDVTLARFLLVVIVIAVVVTILVVAVKGQQNLNGQESQALGPPPPAQVHP